MRKLRKLHSAEFKAQVALSAIKNEKTLHELAAHDEVHPDQIREGKMKALAAIPDAFSGRRLKDEASNGDLLTNLYKQIGRQKVELEWRTKSWGPGLQERRAMLELGHPELSVRRQCTLLGIARSGLYYEPKELSDENHLLLRLLDEHYTRTPFYGVRRMTVWLHGLEYAVDVKRVRRPLRLIGLEAIYAKPWLSVGTPAHRKCPSLHRLRYTCRALVWWEQQRDEAIRGRRHGRTIGA